MSTSHNKKTAFDFTQNSQYKVEMSIDGSAGVYIDNFSSKREGEILFGRNSNFKIQSIKIKEKGVIGKIEMKLKEI